MTTAIKLTPYGEVSKVDLGTDALRALYREIGCDAVDVVPITDELDMWLDDEGLMDGAIRNEPATWLISRYRTIHQPYFGTVILAGHDDMGATIDAPIWTELAAAKAARDMLPYTPKREPGDDK